MLPYGRAGRRARAMRPYGQAGRRARAMRPYGRVGRWARAMRPYEWGRAPVLSPAGGELERGLA